MRQCSSKGVEIINSLFQRFDVFWNRCSKRKRAFIYIGVYSVVFLAAFLLAYSPFLLNEKTFILKSDGRTQHYALLVYLGRAIRKYLLGILHGDFSVPLYDITIGLGADIIGDLNSLGLNDPLNLLAAFVPTKYIEYLYGFLAIFRVYLAGLAFSCLCRYFKKPCSHILIGCMIYCFSGYVLFTATRHPFFLPPMIQLPLLILGLEKILRKEKPYIFVFAVVYSALSEYYHLYMMSIMIAIYFLVRFFDLYKEQRLKYFCRMIIRSVGYYALGIGLSAPVFFPAIFSFVSGTRAGFSNFQATALSWYYARIFRFVAPPGSWNDLTLAAITLFSLVVLIFSKGRKSLKKILLFGFLIYLTDVGRLMMNGFQYQSNRWIFGLVLILSYMVVEMLPELLNVSWKAKIAFFSILFVYVSFSIFTTKARKLKYTLVGAAFLALTLLVIILVDNIGNYIKNAKINETAKLKKQIGSICCLLIVIINVGANGIFTFAADQGNYISNYEKVGYETEALENAAERELEGYLLNDPIGRSDSSAYKITSSMSWGIPKMLIYNSSANANIIEFYNKIENTGRNQDFHVKSTGQQTIATTLLSEAYHVEPEKKTMYLPFGYEKVKKTRSENYIFKNKYALPWGYTYDPKNVISYDDLNKLNGLQKQEAMLQVLALENSEKNNSLDDIVFSSIKVPYTSEYKNCTLNEGKLEIKEKNAKIILSFEMPKNVEAYLRLGEFDINESGVSDFTLKAECEGISRSTFVQSTLSKYYTGLKNYLFNLGYSEDTRTTLMITFPTKGVFYLGDMSLYALPMDNYTNQIEALREEPLENIHWETNMISGTVDLSKDKILCMSIPYSKGWSATVDGQKTEILRGNYMFMAVPLTTGHHEIEFTYCSPGLKIGLSVFTISVVFLILQLLYFKKYKRWKK